VIPDVSGTEQVASDSLVGAAALLDVPSLLPLLAALALV